jgi:hypothetical protein
METRHKHINPHIELEPVYQQRIRNVLLDDDVIGIVEFCQIADDFDASPSGFAYRLHNPVVSIAVKHLLLVKLYAELSVLLRKVEG